MGRKTFDAARKIIRPSPKILRLVMTREPDKYSGMQVPNQLEFTNDAPEALVERIESKGFDEVLLIGGEQINTDFLKAGLINEVWVTIEPAMFGSGNHLTLGTNLNINLELLSIDKLNTKGTILLKYQVI